ncbi:hypothetical protein PR003_g13886 [Phytophthora rubi]|uniref:Uncharacterized protein n=1 Tax=Phytophthora rubi TaxID=129364 RepID=A0A6A3KW85_9STRA|nr:hypothetical protein PR002_g14994 [Phytophthora rubi]KAE9022600.1 hypothetical protein PR001_g13110 [Phytophthora rubi]KAE9333712.1 hypothetical protein PR003_g13886 [Phytophthora rubi]
MTACANCKHLRNDLRQEREARGRLQNDLRRLTDALERLARDHAEAMSVSLATTPKQWSVSLVVTTRDQTDNLSVYGDAPVSRRATLTGNAVSVRAFVTDRFK